MNRKQKVAVVVGALVIAGLALFPPWRASTIVVTTGEPDDEAYLTHYTPKGKPYFDLPEAVIEVGLYTFDGFHWINASASRASAEATNAEPYYEAAISLQLATLALTVAAVVVLKERKAG